MVPLRCLLGASHLLVGGGSGITGGLGVTDQRLRRCLGGSGLLERHGLPIVIGWSFFPLLPTDAVVYVAGVVRMPLPKVLLGVAMKSLPVGTAYAVWTGIGAVGTAVVGILLFKEPTEFWHLFFLFTLIASIVGLKVVSH